MNPHNKKNYLAGPDKLQRLTAEFKSNLKEFSGATKFVEVDGERRQLLCASIKEVLNYAMEYTKLWMPIPDEQKEDFKDDWFIDCRGLYISYSPLDIIDSAELGNIRNWAPVLFDYSVIIGSRYLFAAKVFLGYAHFYEVEFIEDVHFNGAQFYGDVNFNLAIFPRNAFFSECEFKNGASFQEAKFSRRGDFANACFNRVPLFHETKLPQASSFNGATFNKAGRELSQLDIHQEIIALRTLRQIAASYKGQQDEAMFFALEQRYYRKVCFALRLVWQKESAKTCLQGQQGLKDLLVLDTWRYWKYWSICCKPVDWFMSLVYDFVSEYGSNPSRPVVWVVAINVTAWCFYRVFAFGDCSNSNSDFCLSKDASIVIQQYPAFYFALQNLLNPSALVSNKTLVITNNPYMVGLAIFQFCSTYIVLLLAALAIRTRFQKGGGG